MLKVYREGVFINLTPVSLTKQVYNEPRPYPKFTLSSSHFFTLRKIATNLALFGFGVMIARESGDLWDLLMVM